ncbi:hypothetical protein RB614_12720 [Phytohabitans sp. ZYX-F-186]|uniref:LPS export ABC transporter periplasmic protein LptC n=1 Tax=Phytohabitans maris TaxID=3071409 RepID=A0ABU0ZEA5_9ACTN|nr:hypothetical protein [Phytohabitans sp. ZYX-F-186]MDQ7905388.1 hypothetical protein [Phytohabitans sp. ZYX-F-186]
MYVPKQALAWLFVVGAGLFGWWLWWSDHQGREPVSAAAEQPAAPEPVTLRLTIVTPDGETTKEVTAAPAQHDGEPGGGAADTVHQDLKVLAHDGAIVYVGDDGKLTANTGDAQSSGAVTIDSEGSTLQTGQSAVTGTVRDEDSEVTNEFTPHLGDRAVAIAGYENHSVNVAGNDQIVTYDDSNVYLNRNGQVMGNTGDTDSSGLNALFVVRSFVRSGDSADAPPGQEEPEEPDEPDEEQAASTLASTGSAAVTDDDGGTTASGRDPLVIGGDGYDDLGIRSSGNRNIVTYDDSNVVVGGTGPAMTQIGDSDTGGAVVMAAIDSHVEAGNAF